MIGEVYGPRFKIPVVWLKARKPSSLLFSAGVCHQPSQRLWTETYARCSKPSSTSTHGFANTITCDRECISASAGR